MKRRKTIMTVVAGLVCIVVTFAAYLYFWLASTYFYAQHVYAKCLTANTRADIEALMNGIATSREIHPDQSPWGHDYVLTNGEYMIQYMVKSVEPIDIVYNAQNQIVTRFESYE